MVVRANYFHGIVELAGAPPAGVQNVVNTEQAQGIVPTIGGIVGAFESLINNEYIFGVKHNDWTPLKYYGNGITTNVLSAVNNHICKNRNIFRPTR